MQEFPKRGCRVIGTLLVDISTAFPSGINNGTYHEFTPELDIPCEADELWITNTTDQAAILATGSGGNEEDLFAVPNGSSNPGEFGTVTRIPCPYRAGDAVTFTPAPGSTMDGGILFLSFVTHL